MWRSSNYRPLKSVLHVRPGVNCISKYAGDWREKSHEVWTWNSNRSRCTVKKNDRGGHKGSEEVIDFFWRSVYLFQGKEMCFLKRAIVKKNLCYFLCVFLAVQGACASPGCRGSDEEGIPDGHPASSSKSPDQSQWSNWLDHWLCKESALKDKYTHNTCQIYVKPHSKNTQITLESQIFDEKALR